eukprot:Hpha_TRINITY_DN16341_c1_g13::TRINITY_DN16341_c1_g13_i1::g.59769::m.59769
MPSKSRRTPSETRRTSSESRRTSSGKLESRTSSGKLPRAGAPVNSRRTSAEEERSNEAYWQMQVMFLRLLQSRDFPACMACAAEIERRWPGHPNAVEFRKLVEQHKIRVADEDDSDGEEEDEEDEEDEEEEDEDAPPVAAAA